VTAMRDAALERLLAGLHAKSDAQIATLSELEDGARDRIHPIGTSLRELLSDKFVALDREKAEYCYQLCRAIDARRLVEVGTSYGVSTLYLAAAVRDNVKAGGGHGVVIGTE
jgi:predicted O-methyltransferase YrrM